MSYRSNVRLVSISGRAATRPTPNTFGLLRSDRCDVQHLQHNEAIRVGTQEPNEDCALSFSNGVDCLQSREYRTFLRLWMIVDCGESRSPTYRAGTADFWDTIKLQFPIGTTQRAMGGRLYIDNGTFSNAPEDKSDAAANLTRNSPPWP